jgi:hypothetical protein
MFYYSKLSLYCFLVVWNMIQPGKFIYLNNPEKIYSSGSIIEHRFNEESKNKFFFHYINKTNRNIKFNLYSSFVSNASFGLNIDKDPGRAGSNATVSFLKNNKIDGQVKKTILLQPNQTVSGAIEGKFKKDSVFKISFDNSSKKINHVLLIDDDWQKVYNYQIEDFAIHRLGENPPNDINGQFGYEVCLNLDVKKSGILKMSYSPRGGSGNIIFKYKDKIYESGFKKAYSRNDFLYIKVQKDENHKFFFYPIGGIDYPIEIRFDILVPSEYNVV